MKNVIVVLFTVFLFVGCKSNNKMYLKGSIEGFKEGKLEMVRGLINKEILAEAEIKEGKFVLDWEVDEPCIVWIYVKGTRKRVTLIAESGNIELSMDKTHFTIKGGRYNDLIINSWKNNIEYKEKLKAAKDCWKSVDFKEVSKADEKVLQKKRMLFVNEGNKIRREILQRVYKNIDPHARLLAIDFNNNGGASEHEMKIVEEVAAELGECYTVRKIRTIKKMRNEQKALRESVAIGKSFKNFSAKNLDGKTIEFSDVVKKNKYTLLEFWASWCAPCRAELPYLRKDYKEFSNIGFEIFSFSLDKKLDAWEKASREENLIWINTCDYKGWESPVANLYGVKGVGVPANFLISSEGKIVAKNLRGLNLKRKLEELLK